MSIKSKFVCFKDDVYKVSTQEIGKYINYRIFDLILLSKRHHCNVLFLLVIREKYSIKSVNMITEKMFSHFSRKKNENEIQSNINRNNAKTTKGSIPNTY